MYTINFVIGDKHIPFKTDSIEDLVFPDFLEYNGNFYQLATVDKTSLAVFYSEITIKPLIVFSIKNNLKRIRNV